MSSNDHIKWYITAFNGTGWISLSHEIGQGYIGAGTCGNGVPTLFPRLCL